MSTFWDGCRSAAAQVAQLHVIAHRQHSSSSLTVFRQDYLFPGEGAWPSHRHFPDQLTSLQIMPVVQQMWHCL